MLNVQEGLKYVYCPCSEERRLVGMSERMNVLLISYRDTTTIQDFVWDYIILASMCYDSFSLLLQCSSCLYFCASFTYHALLFERFNTYNISYIIYGWRITEPE